MTTEVAWGMTCGMELPEEWNTVYKRIFSLIDAHLRLMGDQLNEDTLSSQIFGPDDEPDDSKKYRSRISAMRTRLKAGKTGDRLDAATMMAVAKFFNAPFEWVAFGQGWPSEQARLAHERKTADRKSRATGKLKSVKPPK